MRKLQTKAKNITLIVFLISALLLVLNIYYKDPFASVHPLLDKAKFFFLIGTVIFAVCLTVYRSGGNFKYLITLSLIAFCISLFFNLRLAKDNYDRVKCDNGISEYYKYFEYQSCEKIKKRFEEDLINGELIYFQDPYNPNLEFEETMRDKHNIVLIGISCTQFTSMECYNDLVEDYINKKRIEGNYASCKEGFYSEIYFKQDSMRVASDNNGKYLSEWKKVKLENDTLYFEMFGEWRDSSRVKVNFVSDKVIMLNYSNNADDISFEGRQQLTKFKSKVGFNSIESFWTEFNKRKRITNCEKKNE